MFLARVIGQVVSTQKEAVLKGHRLLLLRPLLIEGSEPPSFKDGANTLVAVDSLGVTNGQTVLFVQGSSARAVAGLKAVPCDAAVIGVVDQVTVLGHRLPIQAD